jgi:hypothetical protein
MASQPRKQPTTRLARRLKAGNQILLPNPFAGPDTWRTVERVVRQGRRVQVYCEGGTYLAAPLDAQFQVR